MHATNSYPQTKMTICANPTSNLARPPIDLSLSSTPGKSITLNPSTDESKLYINGTVVRAP